MGLVKKDIGELLVDNGLISDDEWQLVIAERGKTGEPVSLILSRLGLATESHFKNALELQYGVSYVCLNKTEADPELLALLPEAIMRQHQVVPIARDGNRITLAMVNPNNLIALDDIKYRLKGAQIKPMVCTEDDFQHFMETIYTQNRAAQGEDKDTISRLLDEEVDLTTALDMLPGDKKEDVSDVELMRQAQDEPMVLLANQILAKAIKRGCSDIHIDPQEKSVLVRYRQDGVLSIDRKLPRPVLAPLISRYKIMANLDIAERRAPQDGRMRLKFSGKNIDFRVSTNPVKHGEKVVMRLLDKSSTTLSLDKLIGDPASLDLIRDMVSKPFGIIFVCGPTGSGKTTTLYSALSERNNSDVNILTVEDPIEYDLKGITQVQVLREKGMDFARVLRAFLRQDPDIMLVGETRDKETAKIAIEAALTGHLVFTSLHTNDAPSAVTRLVEMEVDPFLISAATIGCIAQRLVRRVCPDCAVEYIADRATLEFLGLMDKAQERIAESTVSYYQLKLNDEGMPIFRKGTGCPNCQGTGYRGRNGCYEVMRLTDEIREMIASGATTSMIRFAAKQNGMVPLKDYSLRLVAQGVTTCDEVVRVTMSDTSADDKLCPMCRNPIGDDFLRCPYCQHELKKSCVRCSALLEDGWATCPKCGVHQEEAVSDAVCGTCEGDLAAGWETCPYCLTARSPEQKLVS
jgi:type IV pilus assembly protein PilB